MRLLLLAVALIAAAPGAAFAEGRLAGMLAEVEPLLREWGYPAVAGAATLDFLGVPVPADTMLVAATLAAARGDLGLAGVFAMAVTGMIAGSQLGYGVGRWGGRALLARLPIAGGRVARVERQHARLGLWLMFLAPFVDGVRQLNGIVAGTLAMPWPRFTAANVAAAPIWAGAWMGGTLLVEEHVAAILPALRDAKPWLVAAAVLAVALLGWRLCRRREPSTENPV